MPRLPLKRNWGEALYNQSPLLTRQLDDMYRDITNVLLTAVQKYITDVSPPASGEQNRNLDEGDIWVNTSSDQAWIMTSRTNATDVTWTEIT